MELYKIEWKRSAAQELEKLPKETIAGVLKAVEQLTVNPYRRARVSSLVHSTVTVFEKARIESSILFHPCL
jgi:mRNA-degrading endonuclease RelE of RelBE toxin-antitoxin system